MKKQIEMTSRWLQAHKKLTFLLVSVVAMYGLGQILVAVSGASLSFEAENSTPSGAASIEADASASNGSYVRYGSATKLLWGIGDQVGDAQNTAIYKNSDMRMVTGWYNGPGDLWWMQGYTNPANTQISDIYNSDRAIELIVWLADGTDSRPPAESSTSGKTLPEYALSQQFLTDLTNLTKIYKGNGPHYGPMYVVLFTEFQGTYSYNWPNSPYTTKAQYEAALMQQYIKAANQIRSQYSQAKVALGFAGYAWGTDGTANPDLSSYNQAIAASDFMAVQSMQACYNVNQLIPQLGSSVKQLGTYHKPVMISHFKLWNDSQNPSATLAEKQACARNAFATLQQTYFNDAALSSLRADGLFAWDFMTDNYINDPGPQFDSASNFITNHSAGPSGP